MRRRLWRMCFRGRRMLRYWSLHMIWVRTAEDSSMPWVIRTSPSKCRIAKCLTISVISRWQHSWSLRRVSTEQTCDWLSRWKRVQVRLIPISRRCSNWTNFTVGASSSLWCPASQSVRVSVSRSRWWASTLPQNTARGFRVSYMIVASWRRLTSLPAIATCTWWSSTRRLLLHEERMHVVSIWNWMPSVHVDLSTW